MGKLGTMLEVGRTFGIREGMLRLSYEIQRGSGLMSRRMRSVQGWQHWDLASITTGTCAGDILASRKEGKHPFFFSDSRSLGSSVKSILGNEGEKRVLDQAEAILAGSLPFFGRLSFACGFPPQWFHNPDTGQRISPKQVWTQLRFASAAHGDLKFILEASRFLFVYPLVRAYAVSGDERFSEAFWIALEDWAQSSPPMFSPLWICGQECSLRILAWSFAFCAFLNSRSTTQERAALLLSMVAAHAWRTAQSLNYARSQRSNHLISEAVGLWTAGTLYPELKEAAGWRRLGARLLREAVLDQITPEGVSQQHSLNYQRMILHLLLWTLRLADIHGAPLDAIIRARTAAAFDFMRAWVDPGSGHAPNYGSNDGSLILPLACCEYEDYRPLLQFGAAALDRPALKPGAWDEAAVWLCGKPPISKETHTLPVAVSETGYHRLGDENSWALVRAGRYVRRPFQADQLHADLWWRGINIARDAGTYLYNGEPPWNNGLSRTVVHNTVTVDGRDQMRSAGRFLWIDWAQASGRLRSSSSTDYADCFEGEHDGYERFGVTHRRMVRWLPGAGWVIVDDLLGAGEHELRLHWLVADLPLEAADSPFRVRFRSSEERFSWTILSSCAGESAIIRAGKSSNPEIAGKDLPLLGWESPTYAELRPAVSLLHRTQGPLPVRFVTVVLAGETCRAEMKNDQLVIWRDQSELYRVRVVPGIDLWQ
jgi:heparinase II/III-like protein